MLNKLMKLPEPATNVTYNQAKQMLTFNDKTMTYDENGNLTSVTNACGKTTYTWDARNRLVGITGFSADCQLLAANFKYDALGRRIEKTINGRRVQYLYDGQDIVQEIEGGVATVNYVRTLNIDEPLVRITPEGLRFYQMDDLGSVVALTDETGTIKTQYIYDPFGNLTVHGEPSDNPFQYTGRENDGTGLYYYRARYYSPELQRFISEDPIKFEGGDVNFYAYVENNPINWIDPEGLQKGRPPSISPGVPRPRRPPRNKPPTESERNKRLLDDTGEWIMETEERIRWYLDPDCKRVPVLVCKKRICKGEEVCKDRPVIVKDIKSSCYCAEPDVIWVQTCK